MMTYEEIASDPTAPYWAVELVRTLPTRDPVDVLNALEILIEAAKEYCFRTTGQLV